MSLSVLLDVERLRYPFSGLANVCNNLIEGFSDCGLDGDFKLTLYGPKMYLEQINTSFLMRDTHSLHKYFATYKSYDLLHVTHQLSTYFNKRFLHQKKIVTLHDLNFLTEDLSDKKRKKMQRIVGKNLNNADHIVCISEFAKNDLLANKHLFSNVTAEKITVIYNGLQFPDATKEYILPNSFGLQAQSYILNIGVLFAKKNQKVLLPLLLGNNKKLVLVASAEKKDYREEFMQEAQKLGVQDRVVFLKNISEDEKYALIQNCESMCHPSLAEGFGIPPIEAMYFGKPVFLSRYTSLPEVGGVDAFYFDNFETKDIQAFYTHSLANFQQDDTCRQRLKDWALRYDYRFMAKSYLDLYHRMLWNHTK